MKKTLYFSRNGLMEPLGESQVLPYLRNLSKEFKITLVTFEKKIDLDNSSKLNQAKRFCSSNNIDWIILRFSYRPKIIRPIIDIVQMIRIGLIQVKKGVVLIHCRSYIPSFAGLAIYCISNTPFIFDMRALWPEELVSSHRISKNSFIYKILIYLEKLLLKYSAATISLTDAAAKYLINHNPNIALSSKMFVIPTCVDLEKFKPEISQIYESKLKKVSCIGTVLSGWFKLEMLVECFVLISKKFPNTVFEIVTKDDPQVIETYFSEYDFDYSKLKILSTDPEDMPLKIRDHSISVMFFNPGIGKLGSSPTRLGEILACGKPVIANEGVGDVAKILKENNVGILIDNENSLAISDSINSISKLLEDDTLSLRCRKVAEDIFSLSDGSKKFKGIYEGILSS